MFEVVNPFLVVVKVRNVNKNIKNSEKIWRS